MVIYLDRHRTHRRIWLLKLALSLALSLALLAAFVATASILEDETGVAVRSPGAGR